jgi:putative transposase
MRLEAYRQFVEEENGIPADELIRAAINSYKLTGGNKFVDEIENRIGIRVETRNQAGSPVCAKPASHHIRSLSAKRITNQWLVESFGSFTWKRDLILALSDTAICAMYSLRSCAASFL